MRKTTALSIATILLSSGRNFADSTDRKMLRESVVMLGTGGTLTYLGARNKFGYKTVQDTEFLAKLPIDAIGNPKEPVRLNPDTRVLAEVFERTLRRGRDVGVTFSYWQPVSRRSDYEFPRADPYKMYRWEPQAIRTVRPLDQPPTALAVEVSKWLRRTWQRESERFGSYNPRSTSDIPARSYQATVTLEALEAPKSVPILTNRFALVAGLFSVAVGGFMLYTYSKLKPPTTKVTAP